MTYAVVLDACAFYPLHLRDTQLRLAERGLYRALWSDVILSEVRPSLMVHGGVRAELARQAADNQSEPKSVLALLDALGRAGVPQFAEEVRRRL